MTDLGWVAHRLLCLGSGDILVAVGGTGVAVFSNDDPEGVDPVAFDTGLLELNQILLAGLGVVVDGLLEQTV